MQFEAAVFQISSHVGFIVPKEERVTFAGAKMVGWDLSTLSMGNEQVIRYTWERYLSAEEHKELYWC